MMTIIRTVVIFLNLLQTVALAMDNPKKNISPPFSIEIKKTNYRLFDDLIHNNAALLKRLVSHEKLMYCHQLARAEKVLAQNLFKKDKDEKWFKKCDSEAVMLVFLIARKKEDCNRLLAAMDNRDPLTVESILCNNPYVANHYFVQNPWEGKITPLHYIFSQAAYDKQYECYMSPLLRARANPNAVDESKNTLMHKAFTCAQIDLLWRYGASTNEINKWGHTPLMTAIAKGCSSVAFYLIANFVNLNAQDNYGQTPLHLAVFNENKFIMEKLLERDASFDIVDEQGKSSSYYAHKIPALKDIMNSYMQLRLWRALRDEDELMIVKLVNNNPWMDYMIEGKPLMKWVKEQCSDKTISIFEKTLTQMLHKTILLFPHNVEQLIIAGAQINTRSRFEVSPLQYALDCQNEDLIALLLKYGALVTKQMIDVQPKGTIRMWLETNYADQGCCVCCENRDEMTDLFCKNRHSNCFICKACYNKTKKSKYNDGCPICNSKLTAYGT